MKLEIRHGVISTDDHVQEDRDVFLQRLPRKWAELAPQVKRMDDGRDHWFVAGRHLRPINRGMAAALPDRTKVEEAVKTWEDVPTVTYRPEDRLKAMDRDSTDAQVMFPNISKVWASKDFIGAETSEFRLACIQAYNDWVIEEWTGKSPRFVPQCLAPVWDVKLAVAEVERCAERGHRALMWYLAPEILGVPHFNDPHWDPLYRACSDRGLPMVFHIGPTTMLGRPVWAGYKGGKKQAYISTRAMLAHGELFANLLFSGVLNRFPELRCLSIEAGLGWVLHLLETCDHQWEAGRLWEEGVPEKPSETFRRQCAVNFWYERITRDHVAAIGLDNILWEADSYHYTSAYPDTREMSERNLAGFDEGERRKILYENAARIYRLDLKRP